MCIFEDYITGTIAGKYCTRLGYYRCHNSFNRFVNCSIKKSIFDYQTVQLKSSFLYFIASIMDM